MDELVNVLKNNGVVIMPTDTIYGIVAKANRENALKIYDMKGRNYNKPFLILVSDITMLKKYSCSITELEMSLINKFLPGPLTIILKKNNIDDVITANNDTIGIRIPDDKLLIDIIKKLDCPLISTSANISGEEIITECSMLSDSLKNKVDYIMNNGVCNKVSSTIIKVVDNKVKILREGDLAEIIKENYEVI